MHERWKVWRESVSFPGWVRHYKTYQEFVFDNEEEAKEYAVRLSLRYGNSYRAVKLDFEPVKANELDESERIRKSAERRQNDIR
jgi:hypothetical protein